MLQVTEHFPGPLLHLPSTVFLHPLSGQAYIRCDHTEGAMVPSEFEAVTHETQHIQCSYSQDPALGILPGALSTSHMGVDAGTVTRVCHLWI